MNGDREDESEQKDVEDVHSVLFSIPEATETRNDYAA